MDDAQRAQWFHQRKFAQIECQKRLITLEQVARAIASVRRVRPTTTSTDPAPPAPSRCRRSRRSAARRPATARCPDGSHRECDRGAGNRLRRDAFDQMARHGRVCVGELRGHEVVLQHEVADSAAEALDSEFGSVAKATGAADADVSAPSCGRARADCRRTRGSARDRPGAGTTRIERPARQMQRRVVGPGQRRDARQFAAVSSARNACSSRIAASLRRCGR